MCTLLRDGGTARQRENAEMRNPSLTHPLQETERVERGQFVQDLLLSTLLMEKIDLNDDFLRSLEDDSYAFSGS